MSILRAIFNFLIDIMENPIGATVDVKYKTEGGEGATEC